VTTGHQEGSARPGPDSLREKEEAGYRVTGVSLCHLDLTGCLTWSLGLAMCSASNVSDEAVSGRGVEEGRRVPADEVGRRHEFHCESSCELRVPCCEIPT
jgi:hypothetical protein